MTKQEQIDRIIGCATRGSDAVHMGMTRASKALTDAAVVPAGAVRRCLWFDEPVSSIYTIEVAVGAARHLG